MYDDVKNILQKSIGDALAGGWTFFGLITHSKFKWQVVAPLNGEPYIAVSYSMTENNTTFARDYGINDIIFDHDFCKSLWPDITFQNHTYDHLVDTNTYLCSHCQKLVTGKSNRTSCIRQDIWQEHIQRISLELGITNRMYYIQNTL